MGGCFSQESRRLHERLHEYDDDDDDFFEVGNCDLNKNSKGVASASRMVTKKFGQNHQNLLEPNWSIPSSGSEPSPTSSAFEGISFSLSSPSSLHNHSVKPFSHLNTLKPIAPHKQESDYDVHVSGGNDKQMGRALQLRLAKYRILQMAVTSQLSKCETSVTPVTVDSDFFSEVDISSFARETDRKVTVSWPETARSSSQSHQKPKKENLHSSPVTVDSTFFSEVDTSSLARENDRELTIPWPRTARSPSQSHSKPKKEKTHSNRSHAFLWKEITCEENVTAVAMNRTSFDDSSLESLSQRVNPLMLAMGDEKGKIVITQIIDDKVLLRGDGDRKDTSTQSNMNVCSEVLEFSIEGRIRSLDFGTYEHLVVGGDGCYAWILQIIVHPFCQTPNSIVVVHKLERIDRIYAVRFSYDQRFLAVGGFDGKVALVPMTSVWNKEEVKRDCDVEDDDSLFHFLDDSVIELDRPGLIYCLDWSPTGAYLAIAGSDKTCGIYNATNFDLIHETASRSAAIQDLRWSNDGELLALGDRDITIMKGKPPFKIQNEISRTPKSSAMAQFRYRITSLCWSPSDSYLAIGGSDGRCLLVETKGWAVVYEYQGIVSINALAWGQQRSDSIGETRQYLVLSHNECTVALIKAGVAQQGAKQTNDFHSLASSTSFHSQSTLNSDWVLREDEFRDVDDMKEESTRDLKTHTTITSIAFSKVGKSKTASYLAYAAEDCSLTITRTRDWKAVFVSLL